MRGTLYTLESVTGSSCSSICLYGEMLVICNSVNTELNIAMCICVIMLDNSNMQAVFPKSFNSFKTINNNS